MRISSHISNLGLSSNLVNAINMVYFTCSKVAKRVKNNMHAVPCRRVLNFSVLLYNRVTKPYCTNIKVHSGIVREGQWRRNSLAALVIKSGISNFKFSTKKFKAFFSFLKNF